MFEKIYDFWLKACVIVMMAAMTFIEQAFIDVADVFAAPAASTASSGATETLAQRADTIKGYFSNFQSLALWVALFLGIIFFMIGIIKLTKRSGGDDGPGKAVVYMIAGGLLAGLATVIQLTSTTVVGTSNDAGKIVIQ